MMGDETEVEGDVRILVWNQKQEMRKRMYFTDAEANRASSDIEYYGETSLEIIKRMCQKLIHRII
jgi:hypothetical protein